jgi:hypothetical protein
MDHIYAPYGTIDQDMDTRTNFDEDDEARRYNDIQVSMLRAE